MALIKYRHYTVDHKSTGKDFVIEDCEYDTTQNKTTKRAERFRGRLDPGKRAEVDHNEGRD